MARSLALQDRLPSSLRSYAVESQRPLACLYFVVPFLLAYESGLLLWSQAMRNGADVWLRRLLEMIGFGQYLLLPLLTCGVLLAWHHLRRDAWHVRGSVLVGMLAESVLLACVLLMLARWQMMQWQQWSWSGESGLVCALSAGEQFAARLLAYCGAGIYEELLFRLLLLTGLTMGFHCLGATRRTSLVAAVLISSLIFAGAHYRLDLAVGPWQLATQYGDTFEWTSFLFRLSAGVFFSLVFLMRGFGVVVGCHALYDILISVL